MGLAAQLLAEARRSFNYSRGEPEAGVRGWMERPQLGIMGKDGIAFPLLASLVGPSGALPGCRLAVGYSTHGQGSGVRPGVLAGQWA